MDFERVIHWIPVIRIGSILGQNYDMFGCLFGIRNHGHFRPIAPMRGIPIDASYEVRGDLKEIADSEWRDECYAYTWITWEEIKSIDWEEEAEELDERAHVYEREEDGELVWHRKGVVLNKLPPEAWEVLRAGKVWEQGDEVFKLEKMKRKEAFDSDDEWELLFELMEVLAKRYGDPNVRMVIWFND